MHAIPWVTSCFISFKSKKVRGDAMAEKPSIVMFSGTADKFIPLGVLAQAAGAMGVQVNP